MDSEITFRVILRILGDLHKPGTWHHDTGRRDNTLLHRVNRASVGRVRHAGVVPMDDYVTRCWLIGTVCQRREPCRGDARCRSECQTEVAHQVDVLVSSAQAVKVSILYSSVTQSLDTRCSSAMICRAMLLRASCQRSRGPFRRRSLSVWMIPRQKLVVALGIAPSGGSLPRISVQDGREQTCTLRAARPAPPLLSTGGTTAKNGLLEVWRTAWIVQLKGCCAGVEVLPSQVLDQPTRYTGYAGEDRYELRPRLRLRAKRV